MNLITLLCKRVILLLSFSFMILSGNVFAQTTKTSGIDPNNLSNVKVDELSDEQVLSWIKQTEGSGFTLEQMQAIAIKKGLPASEAQKLKDRVYKMQTQPRPISGKSKSSNPEDSVSSLVEKSGDEAKTLTGKLMNPEDKEDELKHNIVIYGQEFFRNGDIKSFEKSLDAKAPSNYIIGTNDELGISIFGVSYYNEVLKVDARGAINPQQMGPIFVKGLTFEKAKSLIRAKMNQYFDLNNNKIEVTLAYSRSITVNIVGEVLKPGSYKLPALNTAFNALILAGGPNDFGSLRNIQIRRDGKLYRTLDVYAFLTNPGLKSDFFLEDNDYIVVSSSKKLVKVQGEVKRPTTYELLESENLDDLLKYTGGLSASAYKDKIQIQRTSSFEMKIIDLNLDSIQKLKRDFVLMDGDIVIIRSNIKELVNRVKVTGAVNFPGDYNFKQGMKLFDLIKSAGGIKAESELENAYLIRTKEDQTKEYFKINIKPIVENPNGPENMQLQRLDELSIYSNRDFIDSFPINTFGALRAAKALVFVKGMTLADAIRQSGGFTVDAENLRIEVSRLNYFNENYTDGQDVRIIVERVQLSDSRFNLTEQQANYKLQPFDEIYVRSVPNFNTQQVVELIGEVKYPGIYPLISKDERLSSVIKRAGGLTKFAFPEAATFYRPELLGGYIVLKLENVMNSENSKYNYTLQKGDIITIPTITDFVGIQGPSLEFLSISDRSQLNAPYVKGRRANFYINTFGNGFTKESWKRKTYVIQPNTKINRTRNFLFFKIYPKVTKGSTIYVVNKERKERYIKKEKDEFNWNKFIENTTVKLTGLATFFILLNQIKL